MFSATFSGRLLERVAAVVFGEQRENGNAPLLVLTNLPDEVLRLNREMLAIIMVHQRRNSRSTEKGQNTTRIAW